MVARGPGHLTDGYWPETCGEFQGGEGSHPKSGCHLKMHTVTLAKVPLAWAVKSQASGCHQGEQLQGLEGCWVPTIALRREMTGDPSEFLEAL